MGALPLLGADRVDGYVQVTEEGAIEYARKLAKEEGIFAGWPSCANVAAAAQLRRTGCDGNTVSCWCATPV